MKRASYRDAIDWLSNMDDNDWLLEPPRIGHLSVAASLVRDVFDVTEERIRKNLRRKLELEKHK